VWSIEKKPEEKSRRDTHGKDEKNVAVLFVSWLEERKRWGWQSTRFACGGVGGVAGFCVHLKFVGEKHMKIWNGAAPEKYKPPQHKGKKRRGTGIAPVRKFEAEVGVLDS